MALAKAPEPGQRHVQDPRRRWLYVVVLAVVLAACTGEGAPDVTGERPEVTLPDATAPEETSPPETAPPETAPPETAPPAAEEGGETTEGEVPVWVWILLGLLLVGLVAWLGARSGSRRESEAVPAPAAPEWQTTGRQAYADSRWLYDQLTVALATSHGDTQFDAQRGGGTGTVESSATWLEARSRLESARDSLYRVEAAQPDSSAGQAARNLVASLNSTWSSVDRLATARLSSKSAEADDADAAGLEAARGSELQATEALTADRARLQQALAAFSGVL